MLQIHSLNCSPIKPTSHNFGNREENKIEYPMDYMAAGELLDELDLKNFNEDTAKKIGEFAETINVTDKNEKYTKPFKQMMTTLSLAALGGIVTKGFYNKLLVFTEKNTGLLDWAGKEGSKLFSKISEKVTPSEEKTFKGFVSRTLNNGINWCKEYAQKGVDKVDIEKAIESAKNAAKSKSVNAKAIEVQTFAKNGIKKLTGTIAGITSGIGVVEKGTQDKDKDGIPDMYQGKGNEIKKNAVAMQAIEAALDTI